METPAPNRPLWETLLKASRTLLCRGMVADSIGVDEETGAVSPTRALGIAAKLVCPEAHADLWRQAIVHVTTVAGNDRWGEESGLVAVLNLFAVVGDEALAGTDGNPAVLWSEQNALYRTIFQRRDDEALIDAGLKRVQMLHPRPAGRRRPHVPGRRCPRPRPRGRAVPGVAGAGPAAQAPAPRSRPEDLIGQHDPGGEP